MTTGQGPVDQVGRAGLAGRNGHVGRACVALGTLLLGSSLPHLPGLPDRSVHAQSKRPFTLIELAELPRLFSPQLSPDGRTLAYFLSNADWKTNRLVFHLWRQPIGGAPEQLTFSEAGDIPIARWSPDG